MGGVSFKDGAQEEHGTGRVGVRGSERASACALTPFQPPRLCWRLAFTEAVVVVPGSHLVAVCVMTMRAAVSCLMCQSVVHEVWEFAANETAVATVIAELQHRCDEVFPNNSTADHACRVLAEAAVDTLPFIEKQLDMLAWDERAVCAALGKCEVDCCESDSPEQVHISLRRASGACIS